MDSTISNAIVLLLIGMITVFIVLSLVVLCGKVLIRLINAYGPEPKKVQFPPNKENIQDDIVALLAGVVDHVTQGKGQITDIKKMKT